MFELDSEKILGDDLDEDIQRALCVRVSAPTYVVKNMLRAKYPGITTPKVRRRLERLTKAGSVERKPNPYSDTHYHWGLA